jgi:hypothetical protein
LWVCLAQFEQGLVVDVLFAVRWSSAAGCRLPPQPAGRDDDRRERHEQRQHRDDQVRDVWQLGPAGEPEDEPAGGVEDQRA